jgi:hypothetical protein
MGGRFLLVSSTLGPGARAAPPPSERPNNFDWSDTSPLRPILLALSPTVRSDATYKLSGKALDLECWEVSIRGVGSNTKRHSPIVGLGFRMATAGYCS